jgi:hypothetical protein
MDVCWGSNLTLSSLFVLQTEIHPDPILALASLVPVGGPVDSWQWRVRCNLDRSYSFLDYNHINGSTHVSEPKNGRDVYPY